MEKKLFSDRSFLNKKGYHSNAAIIANIETSSFGDEQFYATYKLSDCNRTIEMSIDLKDLESYENTLYKLNKILQVTENFKKAIVKLRPEIKEGERQRKLREKKALEEEKEES